MDQLRNVVEDWEKRIELLQGELKELEARIDMLKQELSAFPNEAPLREAYAMLDEVRKQMRFWQGELVARNEQVKAAFNALQGQKQQFHEVIEGLPLPSKLESLLSAKQQMDIYLQSLSDLTNSHTTYRSAMQQEAGYRDQLEDVIVQVDELKGECESRLGFRSVPKGWEQDLYRTAQQIRKQDLNWAKDLDRDKLQNRLNSRFYQEQSQLVEYRMTYDQAMEIEIPEEYIQILSHLGVLARQTSRRILIQMDYQGKRVSPYYVYQQLGHDIEEQQITLTEQDRQLYEEIVMESVGRILRSRIYRAEQRVEKINELMDERDPSSGLKFSLKWKPLSAEHEGQFDTMDLVKLLRLNGNGSVYLSLRTRPLFPRFWMQMKMGISLH